MDQLQSINEQWERDYKRIYHTGKVDAINTALHIIKAMDQGLISAKTAKNDLFDQLAVSQDKIEEATNG